MLLVYVSVCSTGGDVATSRSFPQGMGNRLFDSLLNGGQSPILHFKQMQELADVAGTICVFRLRGINLCILGDSAIHTIIL